MGLIKQTAATVGNAAKEIGKDLGNAALNSVVGVFNQAAFKEYFTSGSMAGDIIMKRAEQVKTNGSRNDKSDANIITSGSLIDVQVNQCMIIVENGKVVEACMEPGQYVYDNTVAPSFLGGKDGLWEDIKNTAVESFKQFQFGGQRHSTQRVYYLNVGVLDEPLNWGVGNAKFSHTEMLPNGVPYRTTVTLKGHGMVKLRMARPLDFYNMYGAKYAGGDNSATITFDMLDEAFFSFAKMKVNSAVTNAINTIGNQNQIRYDEIGLYTDGIEDIINEKMAKTEVYEVGFNIVGFVIDNDVLTPTQADVDRITAKVDTATSSVDPTMANIELQNKMIDQMGKVAETSGMTGLMGMGMMGNMGANFGNIQRQPMMQQNPYQQPMVNQYQQQQNPYIAQQMGAVVTPTMAPTPTQPTADTWICGTCNTQNTGAFCPQCGNKKPEASIQQATTATWTCTNCASENPAGARFCSNCGTPKLIVKEYKCDKCGWTTTDISNPPKFCPQCGDPIKAEDVIS